jgi:predicted CopG family antitoxin
MPTIRVDDEVHEALASRGTAADSLNDVLRRLLGLPDKQPELPGLREAIQPDEAELRDLFEVVSKHLPQHWATARGRMRQILLVVVEFMKTPGDWPLEQREVHAAKQVAKRFGVALPTVHDKCGRQLYGTGSVGQMSQFCAALAAIEREWSRKGTSRRGRRK